MFFLLTEYLNNYKKYNFRLDRVVHACIPATQSVEAGGSPFQTILGRVSMGLYLKIN
jgi:hypothetical protein